MLQSGEISVKKIKQVSYYLMRICTEGLRHRTLVGPHVTRESINADQMCLFNMHFVKSLSRSGHCV